jgi:hypothetical protein
MWLGFHSAALETGSLMLYQVIDHQGRGGKDTNLMVCFCKSIWIDIGSILFVTATNRPSASPLVGFGCTAAWRGPATLMRLQFASGKPTWRGFTSHLGPRDFNLQGSRAQVQL